MPVLGAAPRSRHARGRSPREREIVDAHPADLHRREHRPHPPRPELRHQRHRRVACAHPARTAPGAGWPRAVSCARQIAACASASPARRRKSSARALSCSASAQARYRSAERCSSVQLSSGFDMVRDDSGKSRADCRHSAGYRARERRVDPRHDVRRELRHDVERLHVLDHLRGAARAGDHRRHVRILEAPRERHLRERAAEIRARSARAAAPRRSSPDRTASRRAIRSP